MTNPDYRAMCAELVEKLHEHTCLYEGHESELVTRARALLAQPVAEEPPAVTISGLLNPAYEIAGEEIADGAQLVDGEWWNPVMGCDSLQIVVDYARAANALTTPEATNV